MLSIQDFPQCPRFTWIASYLDDMENQKMKMHLIAMMALLVHDGVTVDQMADMFVMQKGRLVKAIPRLKKESFVYEGAEGKLHIRGDRSKFLWPRDDGLPTDTYAADYEILGSFLKDLKRRENAAQSKKESKKEATVQETNDTFDEPSPPPTAETQELKEKLSMLLMKYDQTMHAKRNMGNYVIGDNNRKTRLLDAEAEEQLRDVAVDAMQYVSKTVGMTVHNGYCLVCLRALQDPCSLIKCGHVLCSKCLSQLESRSGSASRMVECPTCRSITKGQRLYI